MLKKIIALSFFVLFAVAAVMPSASAVDKDGKLTIGMSFQEMNNPYFITMNEAVEELSASIGAELFVTDAKHDVVKQMSDIEDMIQKGIDILILNPTDSQGVQNAVERAHDAGVIVVCVDASAEGPIDSFVGSKNYDAGVYAGEYMVKALNGKGTVAILDGIPVVPILERVRGFKAAIEKAPGIEIVTTQNGKQERDVALGVTENILQAYPELDGIFSVNDGGSYGALAAIEDSGKDVILVSVDGAPEAIEYIKEGGPFKATSAQYPRDQIRIAAGIALAKYWGANIPSTIPVDVKLITKDNAEGFSW